MIINNLLKADILKYFKFYFRLSERKYYMFKIYKNAPDVSFIGTVLDVVADCLEHATGSGHWPAVKHLHMRKQVSWRIFCKRAGYRTEGVKIKSIHNSKKFQSIVGKFVSNTN